MDNFLCRCGHYRLDHYNGKYGCMIRDRNRSNFYCSCPLGYVLDNLKYLEQKYEEAQKVK